MKRLEPNEKIDVPEILKDLDQYRPKRKGWTWRKPLENQKTGPFELKDTSEKSTKWISCSNPENSILLYMEAS